MCPRRLDVLARGIGPLLEATAAYAILDAAGLDRLRALAPRLAALCAELAGYRVPPALVHGDLHAGNVALPGGVPLIYDWSDACIAHPFLDLATLLNPAWLGARAGDRAHLLDLYLAAWTAYEPPARMAAAAVLAAPLGLLHQAISYQHIVTSLEPGAQWELRDGRSEFLAQLLATFPA